MVLACLGLVSTLAAAQSADDLLAQAREVYFEEGPAAALPTFERALASYREAQDRLGEAITLGLMGNCHKRLGDFPRALALLGQALEMKRAAGDRLEEGKTLSHLGLVFWEMGDYPQALRQFESGAEIGRELADTRLEGACANNLGLVYDELGDYRKSVQHYERALALYGEGGFARGEADALGNLGGVHILLGDYRRAMTYYERSRAISVREELVLSLSADLGNLALCKLGLGRVDEALEDFDRALELALGAGAPQDAAYWRKGKGQALVGIGRYTEGLELLRQAVATYEEIGARGDLVEALHDVGATHLRLGDLATAEGHFRRGIELAGELEHGRGVTIHLLSLGDVEWARQRYTEAETFYRRALDRAERSEERHAIVQSLVQLAFTHRDQGRVDEARADAVRALASAREIGSPALLAASLYARAEVERASGRSDEAIQLFDQARQAIRPIEDPDILWRIHFGAAQSHESAGRIELAVESLEQAVRIIESVRDRLGEKRFRAGYVQDKYQVYTELVRLLLKTGRIEDAFSSAERLRARSYQELVRGSVPLALSPEQRQTELELRERVRRLERSLEQEAGRPAAGSRQDAVALFSRELVEAERRYQDFLDDVRKTDPGLAAFHDLSPPSAGEVQSRLAPEAALLEYVIADEALIIFLLRRDAVHAEVVPVTRKQVRARVELLRDLVSQVGGSDWRRPAAGLAELLIEPIEQRGWLREIRRLYLVPHGVLHYLPFALLPRSFEDGERLLIEDFVMSYLPSAAMLNGDDPPQPARSLIALAPRRGGLRYSSEEVRRIGRYFDAEPRLLLGEQATESALKSLAGGFGAVHLATHGYFNRHNPLLSGLELEADEHDDGLLQVHEIHGLRLRSELVTLSACNSGLGGGYFGSLPAGEDFVGLTRAFMSAGAKSVLSTLWEVDDRSTVDLMQGFYRRLASDGDGARALAGAQRALLAGGGRHVHPYHWAPFVLVGALAEVAEKPIPGP